MTPIFILLLAKISLNEKLNKEIIVLAIAAFAGAMIIISPNFKQFDSASFFPIFTSFLWALNSVFTKKYLSPRGSSIAIFFTTAIVLSLIALPYVLIKKHTINIEQLLYLTIVTLVFDMANILLIWVFSRGKISLVAPFDFLRVVFTTILSSLMLNDTIGSNSIFGIVVILVANSLATIYGQKAKKVAVA
jgi:S-adenosylmethionine uptake transporter